MSIEANKLKDSILNSGRKIGLIVEQGGGADRAITGGTEIAAKIVNEGQKQAHQIAADVGSALDSVRAKIHDATAPRDTEKRK